MFYPSPKHFIDGSDWRAWKKLINTSTSRTITLNKIKLMHQKVYSSSKRSVSETPVSPLRINTLPKHQLSRIKELTAHTKLAPISLAPTKSLKKAKHIKTSAQASEFSYPMIFKPRYSEEKKSYTKVAMSLDFTNEEDLFEFHKKKPKHISSPKVIEPFQIKDIILIGKQSSLIHKNSYSQEDRQIETPTPWQDGEVHKRKARDHPQSDSHGLSSSIAVSTDYYNI
jgi:hypothetical protein